MDVDLVVFHAAKGVLAAFIGVVCLCRASSIGHHARRAVIWYMVALGMSACGLGFSMLMPPWMSGACIVVFMAAVCALIGDGEKLWRGGPPDYLLRADARWPRKERRQSDRRQGRGGSGDQRNGCAVGSS